MKRKKKVERVQDHIHNFFCSQEYSFYPKCASLLALNDEYTSSTFLRSIKLSCTHSHIYIFRICEDLT